MRSIRISSYRALSKVAMDSFFGGDIIFQNKCLLYHNIKTTGITVYNGKKMIKTFVFLCIWYKSIRVNH